MADPKYAGLPGIALDQPDTFETSGTGDDEVEEENFKFLKCDSNIEYYQLNKADITMTFPKRHEKTMTIVTFSF